MIKDLLARAIIRLENFAENHRRQSELAAKRLSIVEGKNCSINYSLIYLRDRCSVAVGDESLMYGKCIFDRAGGKIEIGSRTYFAGYISCANAVTIGDDVLISSGGMISDHQSHSLNFDRRSKDVCDTLYKREKDWTGVPSSPIVIESKSWIGFDVIILSGVTIGEGAVVGAGSVVTRDVAPYTLVAGNPARKIRDLTPAPERSAFGVGQ